MTKENIRKMKREPTIRENIFASGTLDKSLIFKTHKELTELHNRKTKIQLKNGQRTQTDTSPRRITEGPEAYERIHH